MTRAKSVFLSERERERERETDRQTDRKREIESSLFVQPAEIYNHVLFFSNEFRNYTIY